MSVDAKKIAAIELALKAKTEQLSALHKQQDAAREAIASLESERAANAILTAEIASLRSDMEKATESRKQAQQALYDARERFQKEVLQRTGEVSRLLKERQDCEPVAWTDENFTTLYVSKDIAEIEGANVELYAAPPKREPLSEDEMWQLWNSCGVDEMDQSEAFTFARAIERAHQIGGQS